MAEGSQTGLSPHNPTPMDQRSNKGEMWYTYFGVRIGHGQITTFIHGTAGRARPSQPMQLGHSTTTTSDLPPPGQDASRSHTRHPHNPTSINVQTNLLQGLGSGLARLYWNRQCIKPGHWGGGDRRALRPPTNGFLTAMATGIIG